MPNSSLLLVPDPNSYNFSYSSNSSQFSNGNGLSENLAMHSVGDTVVNIKCSNFNNVFFSDPAVVLRNLSKQVIVGMHFLHDNYSNLDLTPDHAHLIHLPTQQYQVRVA